MRRLGAGRCARELRPNIQVGRARGARTIVIAEEVDKKTAVRPYAHLSSSAARTPLCLSPLVTTVPLLCCGRDREALVSTWTSAELASP